MHTDSYSQCFTRLFDVHGNDQSVSLMDVQGQTSAIERNRHIRFPDIHGRRGPVPSLGCHGRDALSLFSTSVEGCTSHQYSTSMLGVVSPVKIFNLSSIEGHSCLLPQDFMAVFCTDRPWKTSLLALYSTSMEGTSLMTGISLAVSRSLGVRRSFQGFLFWRGASCW